MLADAARAEAYRLTRNRTQMAIAVLATPLLFIVGGVIFLWRAKSQGGALAAATGIDVNGASAPLNLAEFLSFGAANGANGLMLICMLIAAATLYAGDYRWETWRLISARNGRASLLLGKVAVMKGLALAGMTAFLIAGLIFTLTKAMIFGRPLTFEFGGSDLGQFVLLWLLSWVRIVQFVMIALLTAVVTRSLLAALVVPWGLGFAQGILGTFLPILQWNPLGWLAQMLLPGLAYDTLKTAVVGPDGPATAAHIPVLPGVASLAVWSLAPLILAIFWFRRQDLSKE